MEENKSKNMTEKKCAVYGCVTGHISLKWFVKFHAGDFTLNPIQQLSRPIEVLDQLRF